MVDRDRADPGPQADHQRHAGGDQGRCSRASSTASISELDASGFLEPEKKRANMVRNLRHWFERGEVTEQELRTLHGVVTELSVGRMRRGRPD